MKTSIAIASYNGELYIDTQLRSLLEQDPPPNEIIITDDGSTDNTEAIVNACARESNHTAIKFKRNKERLNVTGNFEHALSLTTGDYIFLCDQDDKWSFGRLSKMVKKLDDEPTATMVYADGLTTDENLNPIGISLLTVSPLVQLPEHTADEVTRVSASIPGCIIGIKASILDYLLPLPKRWTHDHATAYIALSLGIAVKADAPVMYYRRHDKNVSEEQRLYKQHFLNHIRESYGVSNIMYENELIRWKAMAERLDQIPNSAAHSLERLQAFRASARNRAQLAEARFKLRKLNKIQRFFPMLKLYLKGDYKRYLRGWRTFARDLLFG